MSCIPRFMLRWGLISALALGGITLLIGPERVAAGLAQVRAKAQSVVDRAVDDPMVLRRQLEELADEYPDRIATVRGELAQVEQQLAQFDRDSDIARRVVALTGDDLTELHALIARAQQAHGEGVGRPVAIRFEGVRFKIGQAKNEARRVSHVRVTYQDRLVCNQQQLELLNQQQARLVDILDTLTDEYDTFQTQMWQLDRQIDTIERNQRLIEMTEQLQATLNHYDRWGKIDNLKQLEAKLAELRAVQEAQLQTLAQKGIRHDYESKAKYEMEFEAAPEDAPFGDVFERFEAEVGSPEDETADKSDSLAWMGPIIVE